MDVTETIYVSTRNEWRKWLEKHHDSAREIWFVFYRKDSGRSSVKYNEAVEEALCFGWIDGIRKKLDEQRYANRFTPRKPGRGYSQLNRERLARLKENGLLHALVEATYSEYAPEKFVIPDYLLTALEKSGGLEYFQSTAAPYQRIRAAHVHIARDHSVEFEKRLERLVDYCKQGRQYGSGIKDFF